MTDIPSEDEGIMREKGIVEQIIDLTAGALSEKDRKKFVTRLKERNLLLSKAMEEGIRAKESTLKSWLDLEKSLSLRLEREKMHLLREMDKLSARRRAMRRYTPRLLPPTPVFFDKSG